jgi:hypothetical protein
LKNSNLKLTLRNAAPIALINTIGAGFRTPADGSWQKLPPSSDPEFFELLQLEAAPTGCPGSQADRAPH